MKRKVAPQNLRFLFSMVTMLLLFCHLKAQTISFSFTEAPLQNVLKEMERQSSYKFFYSEPLLLKSRPVTVNVKNAGLENALQLCFQNQPDLTYAIVAKTVVIREKEQRSTGGKPLPKQSEYIIKGKVANKDGVPIEGVTVKWVNAAIVSLSDKAGLFTIQLTADTGFLDFTHISYRTARTDVKSMVNAKQTTVVMEEMASRLDEVIVVGYGEQKKRDVTGSVEKVNITDMQKAPVGSFTDALAGRVAGVVVSSGDGQPGASPKIVIRGNNSISQDNSPLYVIDGFAIESPNNNVINPNDIESMEILKDASATAIYGARGANGVILITTKKGKAGPTIISFGAYMGFQKMTKQMEVMGPYDFVRYQRERDSLSNNYYQGTGVVGYVSDSTYLRYSTLEDYKNMEGTNFQDKVFHTSPFRNYDLSITGGNQQTKFAITGNIFDQDGIMVNSGYKRYQGRMSIDNIATKKLRLGLNVNYSNVVLKGQSPVYINSNNPNSSLNLMSSVWGYRPITGTLPDGQPDENLFDVLFDPLATDYRINPYLNQIHTLNRNISNNITVNGYAEYKLLPNLTFRVTGGLNYAVNEVQQFYDSSTIQGSNKTPIGSIAGVNGQVVTYKTTVLSNENILTYNRVFNLVHSVTVTGVVSEQKSFSSSNGHRAIFVPNQSLGISGLDEGKPVTIIATSSNWTLASFMGRVNYDYRKKYFLTGTFRADGSSKFSPANKWSYFPSAAFKWHLSDERFFRPLKLGIFSDASVRLSYGLTGNNRLSDFSYLSPMQIGIQQGYQAYVFNNKVITGASPASLGNVNLKWETTSQLNTGMDLSFFKNRLSLVVDLYRKKTKDLLLNATIPTSLGYNTAYKNIGSIQNQGLELGLNATIIKQENFSWSSSFNISWNQSKVLSLTENQESILNAVPFDALYASLPAYITKLGQPLGSMYGLVWDGVYQYSDFNNMPSVNGSALNAGKGSHWILKDNVATNGSASTRAQVQPGDIKYKDLNGDGIITSADYTVIGRGLPIHTGGFGNNLTYKQFDLNVFFQWSYGNDIQNANRILFEGNSANRPYLNQFASYNDRWTPDNQSSDKFRTGGGGPAFYSSRTIEDGSYLRLKTVQLGYNIPLQLAARMKIRSFRVYASAQNLFTISNYSGMDPEVSVSNSVLTPGFDASPYPRARTIVFGANLTF